MHLFSISSIFLLVLLISCIGISSIILKRFDFLPNDVIKRSSPIDGLRGVVALSVLAHHFYITYVWKISGVWKKPDTTLIDNFGSVAVSIFFLITGYLFINKMMKVDIDWKNFIYRE